MTTARQAAFRARQTAEHIAVARANLAAQAAPSPTPAEPVVASGAATGNRTVGSVMLKGIGVAPEVPA